MICWCLSVRYAWMWMYFGLAFEKCAFWARLIQFYFSYLLKAMLLCHPLQPLILIWWAKKYAFYTVFMCACVCSGQFKCQRAFLLSFFAFAIRLILMFGLFSFVAVGGGSGGVGGDFVILKGRTEQSRT